jgi:hypothetical protein
MASHHPRSTHIPLRTTTPFELPPQLPPPTLSQRQPLPPDPHLPKMLQIPQRTHTPLPRPSRQRQHIIISEIFTNMKLESDDKRFGRNAGFRGRQCRTWRMRCRRRGREAGCQLPNVRCREAENLRMALDLVMKKKQGICQRTFNIRTSCRNVPHA